LSLNLKQRRGEGREDRRGEEGEGKGKPEREKGLWGLGF
jgi:hypothetical protein